MEKIILGRVISEKYYKFKSKSLCTRYYNFQINFFRMNQPIESKQKPITCHFRPILSSFFVFDENSFENWICNASSILFVFAAQKLPICRLKLRWQNANAKPVAATRNGMKLLEGGEYLFLRSGLKRGGTVGTQLCSSVRIGSKKGKKNMKLLDIKKIF